MIYLLDTNACISLLRHGTSSKVSARLSGMHVGDVVLCSVVRSELVYGAIHSKDAARNLSEVLSFTAGFVSFPFDDMAADECGRIRAALAAAGTPIGPNDLLIASIAVVNGLTLVTHNTAEFGRVPKLVIEDWEV